MTEQQYLRSEGTDDASQPNTDVWRKEIHSRVAGYRSRRGRRIEGAFSMRFPFPPAEAAPSLPEAVPKSEGASESSLPVESAAVEITAESASPALIASDRFNGVAANPLPQL